MSEVSRPSSEGTEMINGGCNYGIANRAILGVLVIVIIAAVGWGGCTIDNITERQVEAEKDRRMLSERVVELTAELRSLNALLDTMQRSIDRRASP